MFEPRPPEEAAPIERDPRDCDELPLVTVVTICLNRVATIGRTIDAVRAQTYPNIEYIVLDGGSTDGTVEVLRMNGHRIDFWRSTCDGGLYAALNEGVRRARGRFIQFAHSDDWMEPDQVERAVAAATIVYADVAHGDLLLHGVDGSQQHLRGESEWLPLRIAELPRIYHPTTLARRRVFEEIGLFRTDLRVAADTDWLLRAAHAGMVFRYESDIRTNMSTGGISSVRQQLSLAEFLVILAREPRRRIRLVLGGILLVATVTPYISTIFGWLRDGLRAWSVFVARVRYRLRRVGIEVLRWLRVIGPARHVVSRLGGTRSGIGSHEPLLDRFARLRHTCPDETDASILSRVRLESAGAQIDQAPLANSRANALSSAE